MDSTQFKLFKQITLDYFSKLAPDDTPPTFGEPYMQFGDPVSLDYTSMVKIHGEYEGCIYITSPVPMLEQVLKINGEPDTSESHLADMCRELSNVLAGNASQAFGGNWDISVPMSLNSTDFHTVQIPASSFIMPITWRGAESFLVVGLMEPQKNGSEN